MTTMRFSVGALSFGVDIEQESPPVIAQTAAMPRCFIGHAVAFGPQQQPPLSPVAGIPAAISTIARNAAITPRVGGTARL
jgi:hypothetical protein